jgi:hypothetical protein
MAQPPGPIQLSVGHVDLSARFVQTTSVVASPALAAEVVIASLSLPENVVIASGVQLVGWAALTVGTSGVGLTLRIRQTGLAGAVVATTGATTVTAANLVETGLQGFDTGATLPNQVYVLTATVASGAAASTVSALQLYATII